MLNFTDDFQVKSLGVVEQDVYDIEVEDNHNFFANDILVHNSIYINFGPLVEKVFGTLDITREQGESFLETVCREKIEPVLDSGFEDLAARMGAYRNAMKMKREKISDKTIFVSKKRYIMNVLNSEGTHYETPKVSVTGIEAARSSTPEVCRAKFYEAFAVIINQGEQALQKFISDFREQFDALPVEMIGKVSGTNNIDAFSDPVTTYKGSCPIHVRGCLLHNRWVAARSLESKYPLIQSGDKIKYVYLKLPNPVGENVVSFIDKPPEEMLLNKYVDRDKQFDKVFLDPLQHVLNSLNWSAVHVQTLDRFFN
jgi:DNA polymerase elongation subunit (family B)